MACVMEDLSADLAELAEELDIEEKA